ncbi:MAG: hypothetical protein ACP5R5_14420 [Armatimonadota bacterium]
MTAGHGNTANQVLDAVEAYNDLLAQMMEVTQALSLCVESWDSERVRRLLDKRSEICSSMGRCAAVLDRLIPQARAWADQRSVDRLDTMLEQAGAQLQDILQKQQECENRVIERLEKCRAELAALGRQREVKAAYSPRTQAAEARFLDGRL